MLDLSTSEQPSFLPALPMANPPSKAPIILGVGVRSLNSDFEGGRVRPRRLPCEAPNDSPFWLDFLRASDLN